MVVINLWKHLSPLKFDPGTFIATFPSFQLYNNHPGLIDNADFNHMYQ